MKNHDLFFAVKEGQLYAVTLLLDRGGKVNGKDSDGWTLLAAHYGHANITALLLDRGAEVNSKNNNGYTPLHYAAWKGHADVENLLRKKEGKNGGRND